MSANGVKETAEQLAAIRARLERITPGPWVFYCTWAGTPLSERPTVATRHLTDADSEFVAHAPADVRWLLAERDRLAAQVETLRQALEWYDAKYEGHVGTVARNALAALRSAVPACPACGRPIEEHSSDERKVCHDACSGFQRGSAVPGAET